MIWRLAVVAFVLLLAESPASAPDIAFFTHARQITLSPQMPTNYFVLDQEIFQHARPDLSDLRIFDGATQVPFALVMQSSGTESAEQEAKILNLGVFGGNTEFDVDLSETVQYNRIRLNLDARDFLVTASVQGKDTLAGGRPVELGVSTLYDFSRESLGTNTTLKVPTASFRYLHVRLTAGLAPRQVKGATVFSLGEKKAYWTDIGACSGPAKVQNGGDTSIACDLPSGAPVDRVQFFVSADQVNFRRSVSITEAAEGGSTQISSGEISRVRLKRGGTVVESEALCVPILSPHATHISVKIANGDDPPLRLERVQPQTVERRIFFAPTGATALHLYYGDGKLGAPTYDYAKLFKEDDLAALAVLGPAEANPAFTGRPDDRPWSERNKGVLWVAMVAAVAGLAVLAVRGLKQSADS